jgi:hypothetical protein
MKKYIFLLICILICLVSCADYEANVTGKLQVVTIGLNYNTTGASPLRGTINDATEFGVAMNAIMNAKGVPRSVIYMLQEGAPEDRITYPTRANILNYISSLELNSNDMLTIFYSGHGQNVWWTKCEKCGQEYYEFIREGYTEPQETCFVCNNNHVIFSNLTAYLSESTGALAQSAKAYLAGSLSLEDYIETLRTDGSATANEILAVSDYSKPSTDLLDYKQRGFFVTAPENSLSFQDFAKDYVNDNTLFASVATRMQSDLAMPNVNSYKTNAQGYCKAIQARLNSYGCTPSELTAFERYWNYYQLNYWNNHSWTHLYMDEFADLLENKGCRVLLISDACFSGFYVEGRSEEKQSIWDAFKNIFSNGKYRNLTVVSSCSSFQTSTDWTASTEDGYEEKHGMFSIGLLEQLGWTHSQSSYTQVKIDDNVRKIYGYLSSVPERTTVNEAMEEIIKSWGYSGQTPQMNTNYLDTVLIP